jgi:hypothetical protein
MSKNNDISNVATSSDSHGPQMPLDHAQRWKRIMTGQMPLGERTYMAPSMTRTPTPPLLVDKMKEMISTPQTGNVHRNSIEASSSTESANPGDLSSDSPVRNLFYIFSI